MQTNTKNDIVVNYAAPDSCDSHYSLRKVSDCDHFGKFITSRIYFVLVYPRKVISKFLSFTHI